MSMLQPDDVGDCKHIAQHVYSTNHLTKGTYGNPFDFGRIAVVAKWQQQSRVVVQHVDGFCAALG